MAGSNDIRAGGAYIELGTKDSPLLRGLSSAMAKVRSFADRATQAGRRMTLFGVTATGAGIAAVKSFTDMGNELAKLQTRTGLGTDVLNGIVQAAVDAEVPLEALTKSVTVLQRQISGGGKQAAEAFGALGTSAKELSAGTLDDALLLIADRLRRVTDENKRVAISMTLFGKSGGAMIPVLEDGAAGLDDALLRAKALGRYFSSEMLASARTMDATFDALSGATTGLRNSIGAALSEAVIPLVQATTSAIQALSEWINQNPRVARAIFYAAGAVAVLGATLFVVGSATTLLLALLTPLKLFAGALLLIGVVTAGAADSAGLMKLGFGDMVNSIRINGQGLATWWAKLGVYLAARGDQFWDTLVSAFDFAVSKIKDGWSGLREFLLQGELWLADSWISMCVGLVQAWNATLGQVFGETDVEAVRANADELVGRSDIQAEIDAIGRDRAKRHDRESEVDADRERRREIAARAEEELYKQIDAKDKPDGSGALGFDATRLKKGFDEFEGWVEERFSKLGDDADGEARLDKFAPLDGLVPETIRQGKNSVDVLGTFNAALVNRLGFGGSLAERTAKAAEETAKHTRAIAASIDDNEGLVFA